MPAAKYDLYIEKGSTFQLVFEYKDAGNNPIDLTNYSARMQVRPAVNSPTVLLSASTAIGTIIVNGPLGRLSLTLSALETAGVSSGCVSAVYDLEIESPTGVVTRLVEGAVEFSPEVTR